MFIHFWIILTLQLHCRHNFVIRFFMRRYRLLPKTCSLLPLQMKHYVMALKELRILLDQLCLKEREALLYKYLSVTKHIKGLTLNDSQCY